MLLNSQCSDLYVLNKMLMTPYINTYYYWTELLFNIQIEKIRKKNQNKKSETNQVTENNNVTSFGIALGIGLIGAVVAFKNKIFE